MEIRIATAEPPSFRMNSAVAVYRAFQWRWQKKSQSRARTMAKRHNPHHTLIRTETHHYTVS